MNWLEKNLDSRLRFEPCDVSKQLSCESSTFDAVFANDVLCHIPNRQSLLNERFRVLKPGGHFLFSDALVIGGMISHEEMAIRSSIGYYVSSPPGKNERLLQSAGFQDISTTDTSQQAAAIANRVSWPDKQDRRIILPLRENPTWRGYSDFLLASTG